jgi:very-short-patch-repair endonuclease
VTKENIIFNKRGKKDLRKKLRNNGTAAEVVLWKYLRGSQILGKKFRRQTSIGRYIVDFYCPECRLIVELDGAPHFSILKEDEEAERTRYLEGLRLRILRFENRVVRRDLEFVLHRIREELQRSKR